MATKPRNVEVHSPVITMPEGAEPVSFEDILLFMQYREYRYNEKTFTFTLFNNPARDNYIEGAVITTQDSDIPPKRNKETGQLSSVEIDTRVEGFAYANAFLYDKSRNVLVYEINKNGCFIRQFGDAVYGLWNDVGEDEEPRPRFALNFPVFARRNEYDRMLRMNYYKKISIELVNPQGLVLERLADDDSIENWIKASARRAAGCNANVIKIEQMATTKRGNPEGLSHNAVREIVDKVKALFGRDNLQKLEVQGYTDDIDDDRRCRPVDLLTDSFNETFRIPDVQVHSNLQLSERKSGIEGLYSRILPEIQQIVGH